jgi:CBS domain-containing protein
MPIDAPTSARLDLLPVEDVMHAGVVGCAAEASLQVVAWILADEQIHCVVVSDAEMTPSGQRLTWATVDADALVRALAADETTTTAGRIATPAVTIEPQDTVATAVRRMAKHETSHLVVVDRGFPTGVLSALDVARAAGAR